MQLIPLLMLNPNTWLIAAAVLPAIILLVYVYRKDRIEKEPRGLILKLLLAGVGTTFLAKITESIGWVILDNMYIQNKVLYDFLLYFVVVAISEEGFKYLALKFFSWKNPNFNSTYDGLLYSVSVSLGFALWENISYVLAYGMSVAFVRAITAIPGHACFAVFMGSFYSAAKYEQLQGNPMRCSHYRRLALLIPILLHGFYDFCAASANDNLSLVFLVFVAVMFIASFRRVKRQSRNDTIMF